MIDLKNKKILITGGSGSIGTYLIDMLDESNDILNIDVKPPEKRVKKKISHKNLDIANEREINKVVLKFKPQILFHLAAVFQRTLETVDFRNKCFSSNVIGTHNIFEACVKNSIEQIIFPSSYLIHDPIALTEESPINPRNITGVAKLYGERELEFFKEMGIISTSLRIFRVYGPKNQDIIDRWIRSLLMGEIISVYGKEQVFDYVHAKDCALGCLQAAMVQRNGIFNIGSGVPISMKNVLQILKKFFGTKFRSRPTESEELVNYEKSYANIIKSKKSLNFIPELSIEAGITLNIEKIKETLKNE